MPLTGTLNGTISVQINFPGGSNENHSLTFTNLASPGGAPATDLNSGDNVFPYPSGAVGALIIPPPGNAVALKVFNVGGGAGPALALGLPALITRSAAQPNLVINAGGGVSGIGIYFL